MESLRVEEKVLLAVVKEVPSTGNLGGGGVLANLHRAHVFLPEVVADAHKVKVRGNEDDGLGFTGIAQLRENLQKDKIPMAHRLTRPLENHDNSTREKISSTHSGMVCNTELRKFQK